MPSSKREIWDNFVWGVFLDQNRLEAEANYVYDVIDSAGLFEPATVKKLGVNWGDEMCKECEREMRSVNGRKRGILQAVTNEASVEKATRCLLESVGCPSPFLSARVRKECDSLMLICGLWSFRHTNSQVHEKVESLRLRVGG